MGGTQVKTETVDVKISPANSLIKEDYKRWYSNILKFILPVVDIYMGAVSAMIMTNGGELHAWMLIPNAIVLGAMFLFVRNTIQDLVNKYTHEDKYSNGDKV